MTGSFWRGRRVLITGHTGFKGAWLTLWLQEMGASVVALSLPPEHENGAYAALTPWSGVEEHVVDLRDPAAVSAVVSGSGASVVLHLGAQALVRRSYAQPFETWSTNVMGTASVLEAVRRSPAVQGVVVVTSDKVYRNDDRGEPFLEDAPLGQSDPYSSSKAACELLTESWRRSLMSDGPAVATARAGNVVGGGDQAQDRLVPDALRALARDEVLRLRFPDAVRPWQHVLEPLHGYLMLAEALVVDAPTAPTAVNFGPGLDSCRPVAEVVDVLHTLAGRGRWEEEQGHRQEASLLTLDSSLARSALGWRPRLGLRTALAWTVEWHQAAERGANLRDLARRQIRDYTTLATGDDA